MAEPASVAMGRSRSGSLRVLWRSKLMCAVLVLAGLVLWLPHSQPLFSHLFPALDRPVYTLEPFAQLLWQHVALVGISSLFAVLVGSAVGIWITRPAGAQFRPVLETVVAIGQTFPPVAVLAVAETHQRHGDCQDGHRRKGLADGHHRFKHWPKLRARRAGDPDSSRAANPH